MDGDSVAAGHRGPAREREAEAAILTGERVALNFLMRMSGIATATSEVLSCLPGGEPAASWWRRPARPPRGSVATRRRRSCWEGAILTATAWTMRC